MSNSSTVNLALNIANRSSKSYGLLSNESTAVMQKDKLPEIGEILLVGRKGVFNLNMLYDWWMIYAIRHGLIKNEKWIIPNATLDSLLADEYIKYGAKTGIPYHIQTYLRMIGHHINYDRPLEISDVQKNYLDKQEQKIRSIRKSYKIVNK
jgi:hypothetical protein